MKTYNHVSALYEEELDENSKQQVPIRDLFIFITYPYTIGALMVSTHFKVIVKKFQLFFFAGCTVYGENRFSNDSIFTLRFV